MIKKLIFKKIIEIGLTINIRMQVIEILIILPRQKGGILNCEIQQIILCMPCER